MLFSINKNKESIRDFSLALLLASLPLPFAFINIFAGLFCLLTILCIKKENIQFNKALITPILYYLLCIIALIWTIDINLTTKYLSKSIFFLLIPLFFFLISPFHKQNRNKIFLNYSYLTGVIALIFLLMALVKYLKTKDINSFFYHELVTLEVNAIYVSLFVSFAAIFLLNKRLKKYYDYLMLIILFIFLILLSSKNVIIVTFLGVILTLIKNFKLINKRNFIIITIASILVLIPISTKIYERFKLELVNGKENQVLDNGTINVSLKNAWTQNQFSANYYFNGSAFRLYQVRIFKEMMSENKKFFNGFGPSTVQQVIIEKQSADHLHPNYNEYNFHNQYLQTFSTLGIVGIILLVIMHATNWIRSIQQKDIYFFYFTLLTTSIMFTESLFERQRGILFFIVLFCIFNHTLKPIISKK